MRLLDLPDEALELLESCLLAEGHGRALLLAEDHGARRSLAREAAAGGWSVRTLEARARETNGHKAATRVKRDPGAEPIHPDQQEAFETIADALGAVLGAEVRVSARGAGFRAELRFDTVEDALALAQRLRPRAVA
jgi:ParB family chromosome partitioning protein